MKKKISNYEALLISLASKGDCTAFNSLIVSHLRSNYLKMVDDGVEHTEASTKLCAIGADLYKKFIGVQTETFDSWLKSNSEIEANYGTDYFPSNKMQVGLNLFLNELHLHLQRTACSLHQKYRAKTGILKIPNRLSGKAAFISLISLFAAILVIIVFYFSHYTLKVQLINPENNVFTFVFPDVNQTEIVAPEIKIDSTKVAKVDSIPKQIVKSDSIVKKPRSTQSRRSALTTGVEYQSGGTTISNKMPDHTTASVKSNETSSSTYSGIVHESSGNTNTNQQPTSLPGDTDNGKFH